MCPKHSFFCRLFFLIGHMSNDWTPLEKNRERRKKKGINMKLKEKRIIEKWLRNNLEAINRNYEVYVLEHNRRDNRRQLKVKSIKKITPNVIEFVHHLLELWLKRSWLNYDNPYIQNQPQFQKIYRNFEIIREYCVKMKGYNNYMQNQADKMIGWKQPLEELGMEWIKTQTYYVNGKVNRDCRYVLGADRSNYKTASEESRSFDATVNTEKRIKNIIFEGCYDIDMVAAHPNIFALHVIPMEWQYDLHLHQPDMALMIDNPEAFLQKIIDSDIKHYEIDRDQTLTPRQKAKMLRSRLFNPQKEGELSPLPNLNCQWYNELAQWIHNVYLNASISNPNRVLVKWERHYIDTFLERVETASVLLLEHDGFKSTESFEKEIEEWNSENFVKFKITKL